MALPLDSKNPGNIVARRIEIEELVAAGDNQRACQRAIDFARDFSQSNSTHSEVVVYCGTVNSLYEDRRKQLIETREFYQHLRQETRAMLDLVSAIEDRVSRGGIV